MRRTLNWALLIGVSCCLMSGCMTAVKEGLGVVRGGQGTYVEIRPVAASKTARPLGVYTRFELGEITDGTGGTVPAALKRYLPKEFAEALAEKKLPNRPGGKTLLIRGQYIHYEDENLVGFVLGPLEEVLARLELVDKDSGTVLGLATCIGRTTERVNKGVGKKSEGLARAIVGWIDQRYPLRE